MRKKILVALPGTLTALAVLAICTSMQVRATPGERSQTLAGDNLIPQPIGSVNHANTIRRPPSAVWPWLAQMDSDRAGWYAYDIIDNGGRDSAERILPEYQNIGVANRSQAGLAEGIGGKPGAAIGCVVSGGIVHRLRELRSRADLAGMGGHASAECSAVLKVDPVYDPLRADSRFQDLLRRVGLTLGLLSGQRSEVMCLGHEQAGSYRFVRRIGTGKRACIE